MGWGGGGGLLAVCMKTLTAERSCRDINELAPFLGKLAWKFPIWQAWLGSKCRYARNAVTWQLVEAAKQLGAASPPADDVAPDSEDSGLWKLLAGYRLARAKHDGSSLGVWKGSTSPMGPHFELGAGQ